MIRKKKYFVVVGIAPNVIKRMLDSIAVQGMSIVVLESKSNLDKYDTLLSDYHALGLVCKINEPKMILKRLSESIPLDSVEAIYSFREDGLISAALVAHQLGLHSLPPKIVKQTVDKSLTRKILFEKNIDKVPFKLCSTVDDIMSFFLEIKKPIIVKPANLKGSIGIKKIYKAEDIFDAYNEIVTITQSNIVLAELLLEGEEIAVELIVSNGEIFLVDITKKFLYEDSSVEQGHISPHPLTNEIFLKYEGWFTSIIKALGINFGPVALEMIFNNQKHNLVEIHTRFGGDSLIPMAEEVYNKDFVGLVVQQVLEKPIKIQKLNKARCMCMVFYLDIPEGKLSKSLRTDFLTEDSMVQSYEVNLKKGDFISKVISSLERPGWILLKGKSREALIEKRETLEKIIRQELDYEENNISN